MKQNYQLILDKALDEITRNGSHPSLLLHACCAPCSSYVLEYLNRYFDMTVFFYNPNITSREEYDRRSEEIKRLINELPHEREIKLIFGKYDPECFFEISKGLEDLPEGGKRCFKCYRLRLKEAAYAARNGSFDFFTTTLSISPHKNAQMLNEIGAKLAEETGASYLFSDFKKRGGYKRSCELSAVYGLYRQDYCGCVWSKKARDKQKEMEKDVDTA